MPDLKLSDYIDSFDSCLQYEKPYCQAACPFHIDINDLIERIKQGNYNSAYKIYRNAVGFPELVAHTCPQPCQGVCPMKDHGGVIELRKLEEAVIGQASRKDPTSYNIPKRPGKIAVIGSGPAGLGVLLRMATKKYEVHLFEKNDCIGGSINKEPNADLLMEDVERQLHFEKYAVHLNTNITTRQEINDMGFDVVFAATGKGGQNFGISIHNNENDEKLNTEKNPHYVLVDGKTTWFAGGALVGEEDIYALAGGLDMGVVLESYIKTGNLIYNEVENHTNVIIDRKKLIETPSCTDSENIKYSKEDAVLEASRCIQCKCDFCKSYEDLTAFYEKWPIRIKDEVVATTMEGSSEVKATPAKRLMSTSNLTGITKKVCPMDIDLDNLILAGRQKMHRSEKAPWAFHDFWIKDMDFANGDNASIIYVPEESSGEHPPSSPSSPSSPTCDYAFFPGCQLGGSIPELVDQAYEQLLEIDSGTGLLLKCCSAPALWSGNEDKHEAVIQDVKFQWESMGKPTLITACPTCTTQLEQYLPEINTISIYEYMDEHYSHENGYLKLNQTDLMTSITLNSTANEVSDCSVFDPCSTRENPDIKKAVRSLATKLGLKNIELPRQSDIPGCCSFGGQPMIANPEYTDYVTDKRINEGNLPYITYCINCRDSFLKAGKETRHILELIIGTEEKPVPTASQRRDNRVFLKKLLLEKYLGEDMEDLRMKYHFKLIIPDEIKLEMDDERILEEEVYNVVDFMLRTNRKVMNPETDIHSGYRQIGYMTYWVSYRQSAETNVYEITDVYCHRMEIELEAVWNGVKTEIDM